MNTEIISVEAHAKINLSLDVLKKREDGYHEVRMIMQTLKLCDEIRLQKLPEGAGIRLLPWEGDEGSERLR